MVIGGNGCSMGCGHGFRGRGGSLGPVGTGGKRILSCHHVAGYLPIQIVRMMCVFSRQDVRDPIEQIPRAIAFHLHERIGLYRLRQVQLTERILNGSQFHLATQQTVQVVGQRFQSVGQAQDTLRCKP